MPCRCPNPRPASAIAAIALATSAASAQPELVEFPAAVIREGDLSPGAFPTETVAAVRAVEFNSVGGWGVLVQSRIALSNDYRHEIYGQADADAPFSLLRRDATIGEYTQAEFSPRYALADDGSVLYSCAGVHDPTMVEMDTLWLGPTLVGAQLAQVGVFANTYFHAFSDVALTSPTDFLFAASVTPGPLAPPFNQMLLSGAGADLVFFGTDPIAGLATPSSIGPDIFGDRLAVSHAGAHWMTTIRLAGPEARDALVIDAAVAAIDGAPVVEDEPVPPDLMLEGQRWGDAISYDINEAGDFILAARTRSGMDTTLETFPYLANGDAVLLQPGDPTADPGSSAILSDFGAVEINEQGDYACVVRLVEPPNFLMFHAILVNGVAVIRDGTPIHWDDDGVPDAGYIRLANPFPGDTPEDSLIELSDRDENDVVRLGLIAQTSMGRAYIAADVQLEHVYPPCPADLAEPPDRVLDFSDVLAFVAYFDAQDPLADFALPEGVFDYSDVLSYLLAFAAGCPDE